MRTRLVGLKRGIVVLRAHNRKWRQAYERERIKLERVLKSAIDIQHVGSTAIPGIKAKPVIDIVVGLPTLNEALEYRRSLERIGYVFQPRVPKEQAFFVRGPERRRTVYLHLVRYGGKRWIECVRFRNALRADPRLARRYEMLKQKLASQYADNRQAYTAGKAAFIRGVLQRVVRG